MKPGIPHQTQNRPQIMPAPPNAMGAANFAAPNTLLPVGSHHHHHHPHHPAMMTYQPNYFGNQSMATPGFIANNFPATNIAPAAAANTSEAANRRKSLIENINPFVGGEKTMPPADLLSAFPVSDLMNLNVGRNCWAKNGVYILFHTGGFVACALDQTVSGGLDGAIERNRRAGIGI